MNGVSPFQRGFCDSESSTPSKSRQCVMYKHVSHGHAILKHVGNRIYIRLEYANIKIPTCNEVRVGF